MIPRGEVGLIFANMGLMAGVVNTELFSAVVIMLMGTTFIAPPLLKWSFGKYGVTDSAGLHQPAPPKDHHPPPPADDDG
jgi:Kef-type K+ transport system membrane component KefB